MSHYGTLQPPCNCCQRAEAHLISLPVKFVNHWLDQTTRLYELTEVLYRSIRHTSEDDNKRVGDDTLVEDIKEHLKMLFVEIEEVCDGHWEPRSWEKKDE